MSLPSVLPPITSIAVSLDGNGHLFGSGVNLFSYNTGLIYSGLSGIFYANWNPSGYITSGQAQTGSLTGIQTGNYQQVGMLDIIPITLTSGQQSSFQGGSKSSVLLMSGTPALLRYGPYMSMYDNFGHIMLESIYKSGASTSVPFNYQTQVTANSPSGTRAFVTVDATNDGQVILGTSANQNTLYVSGGNVGLNGNGSPAFHLDVDVIGNSTGELVITAPNVPSTSLNNATNIRIRGGMGYLTNGSNIIIDAGIEANGLIPQANILLNSTPYVGGQGKVGIANNNPQYTLDVVGDANFTFTNNSDKKNISGENCHLTLTNTVSSTGYTVLAFNFPNISGYSAPSQKIVGNNDGTLDFVCDAGADFTFSSTGNYLSSVNMLTLGDLGATFGVPVFAALIGNNNYNFDFDIGIISGNGFPIIDLGNFLLKNTAGFTAIDFGQGLLVGGTNVSVDYVHDYLYDITGGLSVNWNNRTLVGNWNSSGLSISGHRVLTTLDTGNLLTSAVTGLIVTGLAIKGAVSLSGIGGLGITASGQTVIISGGGASSPNGTFVDYPSGSYMVNWSTSNYFQYNLTGNTSFSFTGLVNGQTISMAVYNSGGYTASWPNNGSTIPSGVTGVKWPSGIAPTQSISGKTDVYTFVDINNNVYGAVIQGY